MKLEDRLGYLKDLEKEIKKEREAILEALYLDLGKSMEEAYLSEYLMTLDELAYTIKNLPSWARVKRVPTPSHQFPSHGEIYRRPYGRVAVASPWNYPFILSMVPSIGALAGGNRLVLKTSSKSVFTSHVVKRILEKVYPPDWVQVYGTEEGDKDRFMEEDMDFLFFTGSTKVGREMARLAGEKMIPVVLELGGKSPVIVGKTKDLRTTARRIIWGKTLNAGQTCVAPDYCLVRRDLLAPLMEEMNQAILDFYGSAPLESPYLASIIDEGHYKRLVNLAKIQGIYREEDGSSLDLKLRPQVFTTSLASPFMEEEIFGPYLPVLPYDFLEEVEEIIGHHPNPLALYLFTEDKGEEDFVLDRISFGGGALNDTITHLSSVTLPFGGVGQSGLGAYHGKASFDTFTRPQSILRKSMNIDLSLRYPPYGNFDPRKFFKK